MKDDKIGRWLAKIVFVIFMSIGGGLFISIGLLFIVHLQEYSFTNLLKEYSVLVSAWCILLASQIAGFSVYRSMANTSEIELIKNEEEKLKSRKVLDSYLSHLVTLAGGQLKFFDEIENTVKKYSTYPMPTLKLNKAFYSDEVNMIAFINPVEAMLNPDLHKYTDAELIDFILKIKAKVLELLHSIKIIELFIEHDKKEEMFEMLKTMRKDIKDIIQESKKMTNKK